MVMKFFVDSVDSFKTVMKKSGIKEIVNFSIGVYSPQQLFVRF